MREICELRINSTHKHLLPSSIVGKDLGSVIIVTLETDTADFQTVKSIAESIKATGTERFFYGWGIGRKYTKEELTNAKLFHFFFGSVFEPAGELCGTSYDEIPACEICGVNRKQVGPLNLKKGTIPKKDIAETIAGEIVVSEKFVNAVKQRGLRGLHFGPVNFAKGASDYQQLTAETEIELSQNTITGMNPFDLSTSNGDENYKCPKGHTLGLNLLSEPHVINSQAISDFDFLASRQRIGVNRGLLRPQPLYFCSQAFRRMVVEVKLKGFEFAIARID